MNRRASFAASLLWVACAGPWAACGSAPLPVSGIEHRGQGDTAAYQGPAAFAGQQRAVSGYPVADPRVGVYVSKGLGFHTRSYWIEGPAGVVLIDTQLLPSAALAAVNVAEAATGKKVVAAIVTHADPDKFNGTQSLQDLGIQVVSSSQVTALIPQAHTLAKRRLFEDCTPDYPLEAATPAPFGGETIRWDIAGLDLSIHVLGPGRSEAHVVVSWEKHLFTGDLVSGGAHVRLEFGLIEAWQRRLKELSMLAPKFVHPGRGDSGGAELLARQSDYLKRVVGAVDKQISTGHSEVDVEAIEANLDAWWPGLHYRAFLKLGLPTLFAARQRHFTQR